MSDSNLARQLPDEDPTQLEALEMLRDFLKPHMAVLDQANAGVEKVSAEVESEFMELAAGLDRLNTSCKVIVDACGQLADLATGRGAGGNAVEFSVLLLKETGEVIGQSSAQTDQLLERLLACDRQVVALLGHAQNLRSTGTALGAVRQGLAAAPTSGLAWTAASVEMFEKEIEAVHADQFHGVAETQHALGAAAAELGRQLTEHRRQVSEERAALDAAATALSERGASHVSHSTQISKLSVAVQRSIGKIVIGLQFHDITSQRLAHVCKVFSEICEKFHAPREAGQAETFSELALFYHRGSELQVGQIESILRDVEQAEQTVKTGLHETLDGIRQLASEAIALRDMRLQTAASDEQTKTLLDGLFVQCMNLCEEAYKAFKPLGDLPLQLTARATTLRDKLKIVAADCRPHAGQGAAGGLLAAVEQGLGAIEALATDLEAIKGASDLREEPQKLKQFVEQQWAVRTEREEQAEALLKAMQDQTAAAVGRVTELTQKLSDETRHLLDHLRFTQIIGQRLQALAEPLREIIAWTGEEPEDSSVQSGAKQRIEELRKHYTMASERHVHAAKEGAAKPDEHKPVGKPTEYGENVELF